MNHSGFYREDLEDVSRDVVSLAIKEVHNQLVERVSVSSDVYRAAVKAEAALCLLRSAIYREFGEPRNLGEALREAMDK